MKKIFQLLIGISIVWGPALLAYSQSNTTQSVLSQGNWIKVGVIKSGVYKLDFSFLKSTGLVTNNTNPKNLRIYGNGGAMLPQFNNTFRHDDLIENAILVSGEEDLKFDKNDFVLFYAEGPHVSKLDLKNKSISIQQNIYSDTSYYFITSSESTGKRIQTFTSIDGGNTVTTYDDYIYHEKELTNILANGVVGVESGSGREWFGESFENGMEKTFDLAIKGINAQYPISIYSSVVACSTINSSFKLSLNNEEAGNHSVSSIVEGPYNSKGVIDERKYTFTLNESFSSDKISLKYTYKGSGRAYLNKFTLNFSRALSLTGPSFFFRSFESLNYPFTKFSIENVSSSTIIWDITDKFDSKNINYISENTKAVFGIQTDNLKEFVVFDQTKAEAPFLFGKVQNQNIHNISDIDFLIITHPQFLSSANKLADFRAKSNHFTTSVVSIRDIYNEFSSGKQDITAIRDFIRMIYLRNKKLKYVLLFGDCSFDYKYRVNKNTNFIPVYESRESLNPIRSYSSDDFIGFLEDNEGEWQEDSHGDHTLEIGVGRIPCQTSNEADQIVNKIINYSNNSSNLGIWRNKITFVADDGDINTHMMDAEKLANKLDTSVSHLNVKKIYLAAYPKSYQGSYPTSPNTNISIDEAIKSGTLILNYTGHGSEGGWSKKAILDVTQINAWNNKEKLPLLVTATCEFGKYDNPLLKSGAELALSNPRGGAIALVTTTRPVFSSTNFILNKAFYDAAFTKIENKWPTLGDIILYTKNNSLNGSINRNFALLGDPSLTLSYPENRITITKLNDKSLTDQKDTLKALSDVSLEGEIVDNNDNLISAFNGVVQVVLFDKDYSLLTIADKESPVTQFTHKENIIFKGNFSVRNGTFNCKFKIPKNINYKPGYSKISLYAYDKKKLNDAEGFLKDIVIGGSSTEYTPDNTPPEVSLFMNDSTFISGSKINKNPFLIARLSDESGINITTTAVEQDLKALLTSDESREVILNEYFTPDLDNYKSGSISYPFNNLSEGKYSLTLKAWDIFNNSSQKTIDFTVVENLDIKISELFNFPNPFTSNTGTTFSFDHDRPEEDLEILLKIFSTEGKLVKSFNDVIYKSNNKVLGFKWNGTDESGSSISPGVYIYRLEVRSLTDKNKGLKSERLVLIN